MQGVDFSSQLFSSKFGIVVPVKIIHEVWSFLHPFSLHVWIVLLLCIPTLILAMVLADYIYFASFATWQTSAGFVLRVACFDNTNHHPGRRKYGKVFVLVWTWAALVLGTAYAGNLTAMITTPTLYRVVHPDAGYHLLTRIHRFCNVLIQSRNL